MAGVAALAALALVLQSWTQPAATPLRIADGSDTTEKVSNEAVDQAADREMDLARQLIDRRIYVAAINRLKIVLTQFQTSRHVAEALARLAESYLAVGIVFEAQHVVAVLMRKFPSSQWTAAALTQLKSAGVEPAEDEKSWISRVLK